MKCKKCDSEMQIWRYNSRLGWKRYNIYRCERCDDYKVEIISDWRTELENLAIEEQKRRR